MSKALGWGGGPWALVIELSAVCLWVCFGKSSQIYMYTKVLNKIIVKLNGNNFFPGGRIQCTKKEPKWINILDNILEGVTELFR